VEKIFHRASFLAAISKVAPLEDFSPYLFFFG
jgi:hypothetical protein